MEDEVGNPILQLRDAKLKAAIATLADGIGQRVATVHRVCLEIGVDLFPVTHPDTQVNAKIEQARARRLRVIYVQLQDYLVKCGEIPVPMAISPFVGPLNAAPEPEPEPEEEEDEFGLEGDTSGFFGSISE